MAPVQRTASKIAWSVKKQDSFGSPLGNASLTRFLKLQNPIVIDESAEHWTDRGMIGAGHDWETQRGRIRQYVRFEIPVQPLPVSFVGYLLALLFSYNSSQQLGSGAYEHTSKFQSLDTRPEAYVSTFAVHEDGNDYYLQDVACASLTLRGEGSNRCEAGGSFLASKIGGTLTGYSWPAASTLRYLYNYAGIFSIGGDPSKRAQLRSFELTLESGINTDLAWRKAAAEADRVYPCVWPYTPERNLALGLTMLAESEDLADFRTAQQEGTASEMIISCLGEKISGTSPDDFDEIEITVPQAVYTGLDYDYDDGLLHLDLDVEGAWHEATGGPVSVKTVEGTVSEYFPTS